MKYLIAFILAFALSGCGVDIDDHTTTPFQLRKMTEQEKYIYDFAMLHHFYAEDGISSDTDYNSRVDLDRAKYVTEKRNAEELEKRLKEVDKNYDPSKIGTVNKSVSYECGRLLMAYTYGTPMIGYHTTPYEIPQYCYTDKGKAWHKQEKIHAQKRAEAIEASKRDLKQKFNNLDEERKSIMRFARYKYYVFDKLVKLVQEPTSSQFLTQQQLDKLHQIFKTVDPRYNFVTPPILADIANIIGLPSLEEWNGRID